MCTTGLDCSKEIQQLNQLETLVKKVVQCCVYIDVSIKLVVLILLDVVIFLFDVS